MIALAVLSLALFGLAGLARSTSWSEITQQLGRIGPVHVAILLALSLANYLLRGLRWHLFSARLGLARGLGQSFRHFLGGFALTVTPGRLGELVRLRWLRRETGCKPEACAPLILLDRASDLGSLAAVLFVALALSAGSVPGAVPVALAAIGAAVLVSRPAVLARLAKAGFRLTGRWPRLFVRLRRAGTSLAQGAGAGPFLAGGLLGMLGWAAEGLALHLLLVTLGAEIALPEAIAIFVFATLAGGLTGAPGGLGGAEAAMIALLSLQGVPPEIAVPATLIIRATTLWFAIALGAMILPFAEHASRKGRHALEHL